MCLSEVWTDSHLCKTALWLRMLAASLSLCRSKFNSGSVHERFVEGESGNGTGFSPSTLVLPISIIPPKLSIHLHLGTTVTRKTNRKRAGTFKQGNLLLLLLLLLFNWCYNPWWVLACYRIFYLYTSLSNFPFSSSLKLLLPVRAISVLVFLLVLMNMVQTRQCSFKYWDVHAKEG